MKTIKQELPDIYSNILPDFFDSQIFEEELATCDNCAMANPDTNESGIIEKNYYASHLKCCTFYPSIPNYLVGAILSSNEVLFENGKQVIKEAIKKGLNVYPTGIHQPKTYNLLYSKASTRGFGKSETLLCPYYNKTSDNCSIWKYRNSVCSTFFCKYVNGLDGTDFYQNLKKYLFEAEKIISSYTLIKSGFSSNDIKIIRDDIENDKLDYFDLDNKKNPLKYNESWKKYKGKEIEFYIDCFQIASKLTSDDFKKLGGLELEMKQGELAKSYEKMINPKLPTNLLKNPDVSFFKTRANNFKVTILKNNNTYEVSEDLYNSIQLFDGYTTYKDTLANIEGKLNIELEEDLLISLFQNRILIDSKEHIKN